MEPALHKSRNSAVGLLAVAAVITLVAVIRLRSPSLRYYSFEFSYSSRAPHRHAPDDGAVAAEKCDIFVGEWIPNPDAPYYTNSTCWAIHEHQNCMKYGRPDSEFLRWRWKPYGCDLPIFDPIAFLKMVANRSMAVVGDSVARNQMQSLICLISKVEYPVLVSTSPDQKNQRWRYVNYNFTLAVFWSPFLVRFEERIADGGGPTHTGVFNLYLDEPDPAWASEIDGFDLVILSSGHWFTRPGVYYEGGQVVGCYFCQIPYISDLPLVYAYRRVFRTTFSAIDSRDEFRGVAFLRTFAPSHFEGGEWDKGGNCLRRRPFRTNETMLEGLNLEFYKAQVEELWAARRRRRKEFRLIDVTRAMLLRPDGHPSIYGHWPNENVTLFRDCVHWCLPGPIDNWADIFIQMLKES